jgi:hypothetical protein
MARLRYVADRDGNVVEARLPAPDFEELEERVARVSEDMERTLGALDSLSRRMELGSRAADPNVYDGAGHAIGNYR